MLMQIKTEFLHTLRMLNQVFVSVTTQSFQ